MRTTTLILLLLFLSELLSGQNTCTPPVTEGLIAYYPFCGNADDYSGNGFNGMVFGAELTSDRFDNVNSAYYFNGMSNYISIPQLTYAADKSFSVCCWLLNKKSESGINGFYHGAETGEWVVYNNAFGVHMDNGNWYTCDVGIFDSVWTHVAALYEKDNSIKFYVNNQLAAETDIPGGNLFMASGYYSTIGAYNSGAVNFWEGMIDDAFVFNRLLTEDEIDILYHHNGWTNVIDPKPYSTIDIIPNPSHGDFMVKFQGAFYREVNIFSPTGALIYNAKVSKPEKEVKISGINPGIYFLQATGENTRFVKKIAIE